MPMMNDWLAVLISFISGATMCVAVSSVWVVLHIPARLQERFRLRSSWPMTLALCTGLILAAFGIQEGFALHLPLGTGCTAMVIGGIFVGMLSSALGEILQVTPVLTQRLHLEERSFGYRLALMIGKGMGAILAGLLLTL